MNLTVVAGALQAGTGRTPSDLAAAVTEQLATLQHLSALKGAGVTRQAAPNWLGADRRQPASRGDACGFGVGAGKHQPLAGPSR
ncbi:MAG: hypothetical protein NZ585_09480 [Chloracidobacterium sp.]|nr:hypothetical protein [Chloracidobacterium sp.]MDW8216990.1 hypothetical protein [Acidobacteriota bacterium]